MKGSGISRNSIERPTSGQLVMVECSADIWLLQRSHRLGTHWRLSSSLIASLMFSNGLLSSSRTGTERTLFILGALVTRWCSGPSQT